MNGRRWMVLAAVVGVSTLSACASQGHDSDETLPTYTPPAWMAEVRAQNEEYANAGVACLAAHGVEGTADNGTFGISYGPQSQGALTHMTDEEADALLTECSESLSLPDYVNNSADEEYDRVLDLRECVIAQGYDMPDAPSREVWTEQWEWTRDAWVPYYHEMTLDPDGLERHKVTVEEMNRLQSICVPSTVGATTVSR